jgi:hypothetical protein
MVVTWALVSRVSDQRSAAQEPPSGLNTHHTYSHKEGKHNGSQESGSLNSFVTLVSSRLLPFHSFRAYPTA